MISNLLLLASAIYIHVDAMRTLKGFISSKILHSCFYSFGQQFHMLDLLQLQELGLNYICYRSPADIRFSWPVKTSRWSRWVQEVDLQVLLHSVNLLNNTNLPLLIVCACDIPVQTQGLILPKHASPVMLNEPASASSSAVRLYAYWNLLV